MRVSLRMGALVSVMISLFIGGRYAGAIDVEPTSATLTPDILKAIAQVEAEIDHIEAQSIDRLAAPPDNQVQQIELLGKAMLYDKELSVNQNEACAHSPGLRYMLICSTLGSRHQATVGVGAFCSMRFCRFNSAQNSGGIVACMELNIGEDLRDVMCADNQCHGDGPTQLRTEARCGSQISAELRRHSAQPLPFLDVLVGNVPGRVAAEPAAALLRKSSLDDVVMVRYPK